RRAERDADIFDGVVQVDFEVAARREREVEPAVLRELAEHVVEERDPGVDRDDAGAVDDEIHRDARLRGLAFLSRLAARIGCTIAHETSWRAPRSAARNASFSAGVPTVTRRHSSSRGQREKSRIRTPFARSA